MRVFPALVLALSLTMPALAEAAVPREETESYVGSFVAFAAIDCDGEHLQFGSVCFALDGSEETVSVEVRDVTGLAVPFYVAFEGASQGVLVCATHVEDLPLPQGTTHVSVMLWGAPWAALVCPGQDVGSGVAGEVTARFA